MRASELILISLVLIFAAVLCFLSTGFQFLSPQGFGPGFVPMNFAVLTLVLGLYLLLKGRLKAVGSFFPDNARARVKAAWPAIAAAVLLFAATYLMEFGSVFAPLYVVMVVISLAFLGHSLVKALALNAVTLAAIYGIFSLWLKIPVI